MFDFRGRRFVWWVDGDNHLRVSSLDKKFIIAYPFCVESDCPAVVEVIGSELPGLDGAERRPVWLVAPSLSGKSMGAWVDALLTWSFSENRTLERVKTRLHCKLHGDFLQHAPLRPRVSARHTTENREECGERQNGRLGGGGTPTT